MHRSTGCLDQHNSPDRNDADRELPEVVRRVQARREKPRAGAFTSANIDKILALQPDLVLTFSDLQADIAADLT
jgi:ABC-type Fe3+-hydroxamate transport system substrate-binding protein